MLLIKERWEQIREKMKIITSLTSQPKQRFTLKLDDNTIAIMELYYYASQKSWYFDIEYNEYQNKGNKVVLTLNAIRHLRNKLPFGIAFISSSMADAFMIDDFLNGSVLMLLLNKEEVQELEDSVYAPQL